MDINIELFELELYKVEAKLKAIANLPYSDTGKDFVGYRFENGGIVYNTESTLYGAMDTESFSFFVEFADLNKPLEFFANLFLEQEMAYQKRINDAKLAKQKRDEEEQLKTLAFLQEKFGRTKK